MEKARKEHERSNVSSAIFPEYQLWEDHWIRYQTENPPFFSDSRLSYNLREPAKHKSRGGFMLNIYLYTACCDAWYLFNLFNKFMDI